MRPPRHLREQRKAQDSNLQPGCPGTPLPTALLIRPDAFQSRDACSLPQAAFASAVRRWGRLGLHRLGTMCLRLRPTDAEDTHEGCPGKSGGPTAVFRLYPAGGTFDVWRQGWLRWHSSNFRYVLSLLLSSARPHVVGATGLEPAVSGSQSRRVSQTTPRPVAPRANSGVLRCPLLSCPYFPAPYDVSAPVGVAAVGRLAWAAGLEPANAGFGDQCLSRLATPIRIDAVVRLPG
jgi:hypothetical protein